MAEYVGMSLRDIYSRKCADLSCKKNSKLMSDLPSRPDYFDALTTLDLSNNYVGNKGLVPLLEVVRVASSLRSINLSENQLSNESVVLLCDVLGVHPSVTAVYVSQNAVTIAAGQSLIELVRVNPRIVEVGVGQTNIPSMLLRGIQVQVDHNRANRDKAARVRASVAPTEDTTTELKGDINRYAARTFLASLPTTVHDYLSDVDPHSGIALLCAKETARFVDTQFPPEPLSIQRMDAKKYGDRGWRRLAELYPNAKLCGGNIQNLQLPQVTAVAWLWATVLEAGALSTLLFTQEGVNPYGFYTVRFIVNGRPRYVVVDDYVPVAADGKPVFMQPLEGNFLWTCILEKAVAKLQGSYQSLDADVLLTHPEERRIPPSVLFCDLTGGVGITRSVHTETFNADEWWQTMLDMHENNAHIVAATSQDEAAVKAESGIEKSFVYSIVSVRQINGHRLLRLHSPWTAKVWLGEWGDRSSLWNQFNDVKMALDFKSKTDKSFWMSYSQFLTHMSAVSVMRTFPAPTLNTVLLDGKWDRASAGGPYFERTWERNPRYRLRVSERATFFLHLSLPDSRFYKSEVDTISFHILRADYFPLKYDKENVAGKTSYVVAHAVTFEGMLEAGEYWIIPSAYVAGKLSPYQLRAVAKVAFSVTQEALGDSWKEQSLSVMCPCSGLFQCGEDVPQFEVSLPPRTRPTRLVIRMVVPESDEFSLVVFVCIGGIDGKSQRMLGNITEDAIVTKSKYLTTQCLMFECQLPGSTIPYIIVPSIQPEHTRATLQMSMWCDDSNFIVKELPLWNAKSAKGEWAASGAYQDGNHNPQFELIPGTPHQTFVVKLEVSGCQDASIIFFVVNNKGRAGCGMKGPIPDAKIATKSAYLRGECVMKEFFVEGNPSDSYLIVPCLQPPGASGKCTVTVTCDSADFQFFQVLA